MATVYVVNNTVVFKMTLQIDEAPMKKFQK